MYRFDEKVPDELRETQEWFASIITRPMDEDSCMNPISPNGLPMKIEATHYITPGPFLSPDQRIEIYNQQYWWRLIGIMQESYPLLLCLFGHYAFNEEIAIPYLEKYPPIHWSLNYLGYALEDWIKEEYHANDKELVFNAVCLDNAFQFGFFLPKHPSLNISSFSAKEQAILLSKTLYLQPYVNLFQFPYHLIHFREEMLKEKPEHWLENDFPELKRDKEKYLFLVYRNSKNLMAWKLVSESEFFLLNAFKQGSSISSACAALEKLESSISEEIVQKLPGWFQEWSIRGWLYEKADVK